MRYQWLPISDIPVQGREFYFEDYHQWADLCSEINLDREASRDMTAKLAIYPQKHGIFFKGFLKGRINSPCYRCLEPGNIDIDHQFELFEDFDENSSEQMGSGILKFDNGQWLVNICQVIREQLVLALPDKILCSDDCQGLCPVCGENRNKGLCHCGPMSGDPRLDVFRKLKIRK